MTSTNLARKNQYLVYPLRSPEYYQLWIINYQSNIIICEISPQHQNNPEQWSYTTFMVHVSEAWKSSYFHRANNHSVLHTYSITLSDDFDPKYCRKYRCTSAATFWIRMFSGGIYEYIFCYCSFNIERSISRKWPSIIMEIIWTWNNCNN